MNEAFYVIVSLMNTLELRRVLADLGWIVIHDEVNKIEKSL